MESLWDGERGGGDSGCSLHHAEEPGHPLGGWTSVSEG